MPDTRESVPDEERRTIEGLDFTSEELLKELEQYFGLEPRQPGDLDFEQIKEYFHVGTDKVRKTVSSLVHRGVLAKVKVNGPNGHPIVVYRKAHK